jgi:hypothetical protein
MFFNLHVYVSIFIVYHTYDIQDGWTALHCAVSKGYLNCSRLLVQAGAGIDILDKVIALIIFTLH